jgi:hypothetical protein
MSRSTPPLLRHPRVLLLAFAVAAAGVVAALWSTRDAAPSSASSSEATAVDAARRSGGTGMAGEHSAAAGSAERRGDDAAGDGRGPATPRPARGPASAGREAYERARNLGALFNSLHAQSDRDALFFAQRALRDCQPYLVLAHQNGQPPPLDRFRPAPADQPMTARRQAAYEALQARCSGFDLGADPAATANALRETLFAANDPRAGLEQAAMALRRGSAPAEAMDKLRAATADGDPYALEQASALFGALRGRYVFVLDGQMVKPDIVAAGWMMAACDAGRSCGAEWVLSPCAFLTECDARDLESSLQRYQLTPSEFDAMQQVRARVMRGVGGGQWDPALFAPQPAPPGYRRWGP